MMAFLYAYGYGGRGHGCIRFILFLKMRYKRIQPKYLKEDLSVMKKLKLAGNICKFYLDYSYRKLY